MNKYRIMLKLILQGTMSCNQIATQLGMSHHTVRRWRNLASDHQLKIETIEEMSDTELRAMFQPGRARSGISSAVNWAREHERCRQNGTKEEAYSLFLGEFGENSAPSYRLYCTKTREYELTLNPVMRVEHVPGYAVQTDFAGMVVEALANESDNVVKCKIFVAALPYSGLLAASPTRSENTIDHLEANIRAFEYYGCVPQIAVPDNLKAAVIARPKFGPAVLNEQYQAGLLHYGMGAMPARPYRPQDKSAVENGVKLIQRRVAFKLRGRPIPREAEIEVIINEAVEYWNNRLLKRGNGHSRRSLFEAEEREHMRPLPERRFEPFILSSKRRVAKDYHLEFDKNYYSVPHKFKSFDAEVKAERKLIHIMIDGLRVATHLRLSGQRQRSTHPDHPPLNHRAFNEMDLRVWAQRFCIEVQQLVEVELQSPRSSVQAKQRCKWVQDLPRFHSAKRFEAACIRAVELRDMRFEHVENVLKRRIENTVPPPRFQHPCDRRKMSAAPTTSAMKDFEMSAIQNKHLFARLRMPGATSAYEQQLLSTSFSDMLFDDRLEHILTSEVYARDERSRNRLLARAKLKHRADPNEIIFDAERGLEKAYVAELLTCRWTRNADNVLITGAAGTGKTWLACALAVAAINLGLSVRYVRTNAILEELGLAHLDGSIAKMRASLVNCSVLILDDFGIAAISEKAKEDMLELLDGRVDNGATIVIGQLDVTEWHNYLDSPHLADAIMDRLSQRAHKISLKGKSLRQRRQT